MASSRTIGLNLFRILIALLAALCFMAPLSAHAQSKVAADDSDFGLTDSDFLQAINSIGLKIRVGIIGQTDNNPRFSTNLITYGFGPCVVATAETDVKNKHILSMQVSPTADDYSGCSADDREMKNLVFIVTVEVLRVVTKLHDIKEIGDTLGTLARKLQRDPNSGMRSAEMKVGGRTVQMMSLLDDSRIEFRIYAE